MNLVDFLAIVPFYVEVIAKAVTTNGSPSNGALTVIRVVRIARVFRLLKLGKNQQGLEILSVTMSRSSSLLFCISYVVFLLQVIMASILFSVEAHGKCLLEYRCVGGESNLNNCTALSFTSTQGWLEDQEAVIAGPPLLVSPTPYLSSPDHAACGMGSVCSDVGNLCFQSDGALSDFNSIPNALWWSLVSTTTVGFGEMVPATAFGKLVGAVGCVFGVVVLAMPTTVLGLEFSKAYDEYKENQKGSKQARLLLKGLRSVSQEDEVTAAASAIAANQNVVPNEVAEEEFSQVAKKRFIVDMQLAIKAAESGIRAQDIALLVGPEARQQLAKQQMAKTLKVAAIGLEPPNSRLEWKALGKSTLKQALDDIPDLLAISALSTPPTCALAPDIAPTTTSSFSTSSTALSPGPRGNACPDDDALMTTEI